MGTVPAVPMAYDQRQSYYDPAKPADQQQQYMYAPYGQQHPQQGLYPGAYPGPYPPPQPSELDSTALQAGQQGNPIEMSAVQSPRP
jgi:hypothetical protein